MQSSFKSTALALKRLLQHGVPFYTGLVPLDSNSSKLFYEVGNQYRAVSFPPSSSADIKVLAAACEAATRGVNHEDILGEPYRKAWKMDTEKFSTQLSIEGPIRQALSDIFLKGDSGAEAGSLSAQLYKLNVYVIPGPGSFFKGHVDTPRSTKMVGSLVIVLPTDHEGGSLVFRDHGREWTFDSAEAVSTDRASPTAAFVAFYSDIEHEVLPVVSGYRVTLTYNIYVNKEPSVPSIILAPDTNFKEQIKEKIRFLLSANSSLNDDGLIGCGLGHKYPFDCKSSSSLKPFAASLKGLDAIIYAVLKEMDLNPKIMANYDEEGLTFLFPGFVDLPEDEQLETSLKDWLAYETGSIMTYDALKGYSESRYDDYSDDDEDMEALKSPRPILWLKEPTEANSFKANFIAFGNMAAIDCAHGNVCIVAVAKSPKLTEST